MSLTLAPHTPEIPEGTHRTMQLWAGGAKGSFLKLTALGILPVVLKQLLPYSTQKNQ